MPRKIPHNFVTTAKYYEILFFDLYSFSFSLYSSLSRLQSLQSASSPSHTVAGLLLPLILQTPPPVDLLPGYVAGLRPSLQQLPGRTSLSLGCATTPPSLPPLSATPPPASPGLPPAPFSSTCRPPLTGNGPSFPSRPPAINSTPLRHLFLRQSTPPSRLPPAPRLHTSACSPPSLRNQLPTVAPHVGAKHNPINPTASPPCSASTPALRYLHNRSVPNSPLSPLLNYKPLARVFTWW